jgi:NAD(P)H dehydrogenase (quinone)
MLIVAAEAGRVARAIAATLADLPGPKRFALVGAAEDSPPGGYERSPRMLDEPGGRLKALAGVRDVVLLPALDHRSIEVEVSVASLARQAGVERVHCVSLVGANPKSPVTLLRWHGLVERAVAASGLPHTILRCSPFMQAIFQFARRDASGLALVGPFRDATFPWLDAADAGEVLRRRIAERAANSIEVQVSGPREIGFDGLAAMLAERLHEPVRYVDLCLPETQGMLEARGVPLPRIRVLTEYWDYLASGVVRTGCCDTVVKLLGREPHDLADYFSVAADEFRVAA